MAQITKKKVKKKTNKELDKLERDIINALFLRHLSVKDYFET